MRDLTVSVVQLAAEEVWRDEGAAKRNVDRIIDRYLEVADDSDLVVMPELATSGYIPLKGYDQDKKHLMAAAARSTWETLLPRVVEATAGRRASLVVGALEPSTMRNEMHNASLMIEEGDIIGVHRKMHLPVEENHYFVPGDRVAVARSRLGRVGLLVCYDLLFPESARLAALQGAELVCVISNWLDIGNLRDLGRLLPPARALESQMHVVFVNGVGELEARGRTWSLYGRSTIVAATGEVRAAAGSGSETVTAELAESDLATAAGVFPVLRDRRPDAYAPLAASRESFAGRHQDTALKKSPDRSEVEEYLDVDGAPTPKGQRTRARILTSARRNLEERGYFEATVTEITSGSDVAPGTFYRYFPSKEVAFMVVLEHLVTDLHQAARGTWDAEDPLASLEEATRRYLVAYRDNAELVRALLQMSVTVPECEAKWAELRQMTYERMARNLPEHVDGLDAEIAISALADMVEQFARRWYVAPPARGKRPPNIDQAAKTLALVWYRTLLDNGVHA